MNLLTIDHLHVSLAGREVLRDVSLVLSPGEVVSLIGANGCGKTTLLRAALGHVPSTGTVTWHIGSAPADRVPGAIDVSQNGPPGRTLHEIPRRQLARIAAYLPQSPTIEPGDRVIDTLRLGRSPYQSAFGIEREEDEQIVQSVAAELELLDLLHRPIDSLSGGQRQRVLLGRCLVQSPRALLLDEPTTFLDMKHQVDLHRLLRRLADDRKIGVLISSHDLNLAAVHSDRVVVMKAGRVLAQGAPGDVLTESLLSEAFDVPVRVAMVDGQRFFSH